MLARDYRLVTVYFDPGPHGRYDARRLLEVYRASARACGENLEVVDMDTPGLDRHSRVLTENTAKLAVWRDIVDKATAPVVITDADMMMLRGGFGPAFDQDFDVAITWRKEGRKTLMLNGGAFFARPTDAARRFMASWCEINDRMMADARFHTKWEKIYGGINQAALGYMIETPGVYDARLVKLPCRIWNAVDEDWPHAMNGDTRLVHIKGHLRKACLKNKRRIAGSNLPGTRRVIERWRKYDAASQPVVNA